MKYKTSELTGALLDAAVAKADGWAPSKTSPEIWLPPKGVRVQGPRHVGFDGVHGFRPSDHWEHGGPIIERERIDITAHGNGWSAGYGQAEYGPTPLIAAMRAFCCAKLGDEIDL